MCPCCGGGGGGGVFGGSVASAPTIERRGQPVASTATKLPAETVTIKVVADLADLNAQMDALAERFARVAEALRG